MICIRLPSVASMLPLLLPIIVSFAPVPMIRKAQEFIPELAESWEVSDGGQTIIFHLHKGVKWHDGTPFSSADAQIHHRAYHEPAQGYGEPPRAGV